MFIHNQLLDILLPFKENNGQILADPFLQKVLSSYADEDAHNRRFETHFNCSLQHLKTINFMNFYGALSENKSILSLVKYLLKNATMLEKFAIAAILERSDTTQDYVKLKQEFMRFPRSSPNASVVFSS